MLPARAQNLMDVMIEEVLAVGQSHYGKDIYSFVFACETWVSGLLREMLGLACLRDLGRGAVLQETLQPRLAAPR